MVVKLTFPKGSKGDQTVELEYRDAQEEIKIAVENGYIPVYNGKSILAEDVKDGQEITLLPMVKGG
jgi:molybdopterin converting factor small subunit